VTEGVTPPSSDGARSPGVAVLAFHRVVRRPERDHDIGWTDFCALLDSLDPSRVTTELGADPSMFRDVRFALTFDDATEDHVDVALELDRRGVRGVFFVPPGRLGQPPFMGTSALRSIDERGHVVGAHGLNHVRLSGLSAEALLREVKDPKVMLEDLLGHPVDLFAPPGGAYARHLPAQLSELGYVAARSMIWGVYGSANDRWRIPCVPVTSFVLKRGWLSRTLETGRMPAAMGWTWRAKEILPLGLRSFVRGAVHARKRAAAE
jgi:peptidoglycan/xylan/chitin deacetylase (PgdA/CDA1 family)